MEKFSLKWNDFQTIVSNSFKSLKQEKDFFDVTLIAEDQKQIDSHKVILSACSSFFKPILQNNKHSHPLIYLSGINSTNLQLIIDYVYEGEVQLFQEQLDSFLAAAQKLQIAGLLSSRQKEEIDNKDFGMENAYINDVKGEEEEEEEEEEKEKTSLEMSGLENKKKRKINKALVPVNGHNKNEVNQKINELLIKDDDIIKCSACGKKSKDLSNMKRHAEVHMEGLSYECHVCKNTFR